MASSPKARGTFALVVLTAVIVWSLPRVGETQSGGVPEQLAHLEAKVVALESALAAEAAARAGADTTLQNNINAILIGGSLATDAELAAESAARMAADTTLQNNINAEAAARQAADTTLQNNINNEAAARAAADHQLQNNIDAEAAARQAADTTLQNNINAIGTGFATTAQLGAEAAARMAADTTLQNNIDAEAAARAQGDVNTLAAANTYTDSSVAAEAAARSAADTTLQGNIDAEAAARALGDVNTLAAANTYTDSSVAAEAAARSAADTTLQSNIDAEAAARAAADQNLQNQIDALETCSCNPPPPVPQQLLDLAQFLTIEPGTIDGLTGPHVILTNANLHLRNGAATTSPSSYAANGLGNLVLGYNSVDGAEDPSEILSLRYGSHNLIIGDRHVYTGSGGFIGGFANFLHSDGAAVLGGVNNAVFAPYSTILGGDSLRTDTGGGYFIVPDPRQ